RRWSASGLDRALRSARVLSCRPRDSQPSRRGTGMSPTPLFQLHLLLGYVAWLLCFVAYIWPRVKAMDAADAHRAIATLHSFRFFGLAFLLPGVVGPDLPARFAGFAAYGDFATGVLALLPL